MTIEEISDLLDYKLDKKLSPINDKLSKIEIKLSEIDSKITTMENKIDKILAFVPIGNEDLFSSKKMLKKAH